MIFMYYAFCHTEESLEPDLHFNAGMKTQQGSTVVGVFEDRIHANKAITELHQAGFNQSQIGVAMPHAEGRDNIAATESDSHAGSGALTGALTGLGLGPSQGSASFRE